MNKMKKIAEKSKDEIELDAIWKKCNLPLENNIRLKDSVGKTIKFAKTTSVRTNNTILFVFTDDTFLILKNSFDYISDSVSFTLEQDENYLELMLEGGLLSQEIFDKYTKFWRDRRLQLIKENEIATLKNLLKKYPDVKND